jgi:hypothetical protein
MNHIIHLRNRQHVTLARQQIEVEELVVVQRHTTTTPIAMACGSVEH